MFLLRILFLSVSGVNRKAIGEFSWNFRPYDKIQLNMLSGLSLDLFRRKRHLSTQNTRLKA